MEQITLNKDTYEELMNRRYNRINELEPTNKGLLEYINRFKDDLANSDKVIWISHLGRNKEGIQQVKSQGIITSSMEVKECIEYLKRKYTKKNWFQKLFNL